MQHSSQQPHSPLWTLACHMGSHSVTCHSPEVTFPFTTAKVGTRLRIPEVCKAEIIKAVGQLNGTASATNYTPNLILVMSACLTMRSPMSF